MTQVSPPTDGSSASPATPGSRDVGASRGRLVVTLLLVIVWVGGLVMLVWRSSRDTVLNARQIQHADSIVLGTWDREQNVLRVEKVWKLPIKEPTLRLDPPAELSRSTGPVIVPLVITGPNRYVIADDRQPLPHGHELKLRPIYPATKDTLRQLERILEELTRPTPPQTPAAPLK